MRIEVFELHTDDWNEAEMAQHGVTPKEIRQVLDGAPVFLPNKKGHHAPVVMIGPTFGGRLLTVPLGPVDRAEGVWRPATAWDSDADEQVRYYRALKQ